MWNSSIPVMWDCMGECKGYRQLCVLSIGMLVSRSVGCTVTALDLLPAATALLLDVHHIGGDGDFLPLYFHLG